ncbi:MAG: M48 family metallopeptidase [Candidatus Marinimicrobia bacterium]|nr:M48 family metallopeptidase [Candidatus Neomarinimicrobiota bacterium]MCF7828692.1 M48 family metallopeptidase [Candidatus Neomarinimicrobiota bacterium]MCF7880433.1 M48 family metallopeptidase [Candidatus Neomarinimicrobiota bacterium]
MTKEFVKTEAGNPPEDREIPGQSTNDYQRRKQYNRTKIWLGLANLALTLVFLLLLVLSPLSRVFAGWAMNIWSNPYGSLLLFALFVGVAEMIVGFPLSFYTGYSLEHKYNLSEQSLGSYFWEKAKGMMVGTVIGVPVLLLFYYFLRAFGNGWWLPTAILMFVLTILLSRIAPKAIMPLFYDFDPIDREELKQRIAEMAEGVGLSVEGIFQFNLSKETKKANAAFTGIGKAKRVILGDTLLENFSNDEIMSVVAHELGHFKEKHIWKLSAVGTVFTFAGLYLVSRLYAYIVSVSSFDSITSLAALPLITLFLILFNFVIGPVQNALSRHYERQADDYSIKLFGRPKITIQSLEKLAEQNLADPDPHPAIEFLFYSHPSIPNRVQRIREQHLS